jgi:insertion element IS1 protein InsB
LTIQCDEMWSFVGDKGHVQWVWLALDVDTREVVGVHVGDRDAEGARGLWRSLPAAVYRQCANAYTDLWVSYEEVFPRCRHRPSPKRSGKTSLIERLNNTLRQRIWGLVRKTLSFSKSWRIISAPPGSSCTITTPSAGLVFDHH